MGFPRWCGSEKEKATRSSILAWRILPRDRKAWWAAVCGITQSQTQLKQLSSSSSEEFTCQCGRYKRRGLDPWVRKVRWSRKWQPTPLFLPGKFHGQRRVASYSPCGRKESYTTERFKQQLPVVVQPFLQTVSFSSPLTPILLHLFIRLSL